MFIYFEELVYTFLFYSASLTFYFSFSFLYYVNTLSFTLMSYWSLWSVFYNYFYFWCADLFDYSFYFFNKAIYVSLDESFYDRSYLSFWVFFINFSCLLERSSNSDYFFFNYFSIKLKLAKSSLIITFFLLSYLNSY